MPCPNKTAAPRCTQGGGSKFIEGSHKKKGAYLRSQGQPNADRVAPASVAIIDRAGWVLAIVGAGQVRPLLRRAMQ